MSCMPAIILHYRTLTQNTRISQRGSTTTDGLTGMFLLFRLACAIAHYLVHTCMLMRFSHVIDIIILRSNVPNIRTYEQTWSEISIGHLPSDEPGLTASLGLPGANKLDTGIMKGAMVQAFCQQLCSLSKGAQHYH